MSKCEDQEHAKMSTIIDIDPKKIVLIPAKDSMRILTTNMKHKTRYRVQK